MLTATILITTVYKRGCLQAEMLTESDSRQLHHSPSQTSSETKKMANGSVRAPVVKKKEHRCTNHPHPHSLPKPKTRNTMTHQPQRRTGAIPLLHLPSTFPGIKEQNGGSSTSCSPSLPAEAVAHG